MVMNPLPQKRKTETKQRRESQGIFDNPNNLKFKIVLVFALVQKSVYHHNSSLISDTDIDLGASVSLSS